MFYCDLGLNMLRGFLMLNFFCGVDGLINERIIVSLIKSIGSQNDDLDI